jgi:hypothetical protein
MGAKTQNGGPQLLVFYWRGGGIHVVKDNEWVWVSEIVGSRGSEDKMSQCPISHESTVGAISCKGLHKSWPLGMPQNATRLISRRISQNCVYVPVDIW